MASHERRLIRRNSSKISTTPRTEARKLTGSSSAYQPADLLGMMSTRVPCFTHPPNVRLTILSYPTPTIMKHILFLMFAFTTVLAVSCNKQKQAIDSQTEASKTAIDHQKEAVDTHAKQAKEQVDINAKIDKANIEAKQAAEQAQLDADKKKAEAEAAAAKAKVDAEKK